MLQGFLDGGLAPGLPPTRSGRRVRGARLLFTALKQMFHLFVFFQMFYKLFLSMLLCFFFQHVFCLFSFVCVFFCPFWFSLSLVGKQTRTKDIHKQTHPKTRNTNINLRTSTQNRPKTRKNRKQLRRFAQKHTQSPGKPNTNEENNTQLSQIEDFLLILCS